MDSTPCRGRNKDWLRENEWQERDEVMAASLSVSGTSHFFTDFSPCPEEKSCHLRSAEEKGET
jgi:hypothetical protein